MILYAFDAVLVSLAYLLGSIPFGLLLTCKAGLGDIRDIGSGNIGATNVLRTGRKDIALLTLLLDGIKGGISVWIASMMVSAGFGSFQMIPWVGAAAVLGHVFPVWLKFKGGKGVITSFAVFTVLDWSFGLFVISIWFSVFFLSRISSLSALVAMIAAMIVSLVVYQGTPFCFMVVSIALLVLVKHHSNIVRLLKGEESRPTRK